MRARCGNRKTPGYERYGGRGISVCSQWSDFDVFLADVGPRPGPDFSIDRIDNDGNYEPSNVRWATRHQQNRNKRSTKRITLNGGTKCLVDWSRELDLPVTTIITRMKKSDDPVFILRPVVAPKNKLPCKFQPCEGLARSLGMCDKHYCRHKNARKNLVKS